MHTVERKVLSREREEAVEDVVRRAVDGTGLQVCTIPKVLFCRRCARPLGIWENNSRPQPEGKGFRARISPVSHTIAQRLGIPVFVWVVYHFTLKVDLTYFNPRTDEAGSYFRLSPDEWLEVLSTQIPERCPECREMVSWGNPLPVNPLPVGEDDGGYNSLFSEIFSRNYLPQNWKMSDIDLVVFHPFPQPSVVAIVEGTTEVSRSKRVKKTLRFSECLGVPLHVLFFSPTDLQGFVVKGVRSWEVEPPRRLYPKSRVVSFLREVLHDGTKEKELHFFN